jgi:type I restriction enzyme, R subunit
VWQHLPLQVGLHILIERHILGVAERAIRVRLALCLAVLDDDVSFLIAQRALDRDGSVAKGAVREDARERCELHVATLGRIGRSFPFDDHSTANLATFRIEARRKLRLNELAGLAGIQAVQTLSRLNRAHPGKDTTYVLDFVNSSEEILEAFRAYYDTAELEATTDPNLVYNLRQKLDAQGFYDHFEVDRVASVEMNPAAKQSDLIAAIEPAADRLLRRYKAAQQALASAKERGDDTALSAAQDEINSLLLFRNDMGAYNRLYGFLSQIIDYGSTAIEKRYLFYKRLIPLLEFGREREGVDLSKVVLTHHALKDKGQRRLTPDEKDPTKLQPITEAGGGAVQDKDKVLLAEIIERVNDLFGGDTTDGDKLSFVTAVRDKMLESNALVLQANNNEKSQFANSPTLGREMMNAIMDALAAHQTLSTQLRAQSGGVAGGTLSP